jgi:hypothetical protein
MTTSENIYKKDLIKACQFYSKQENRDYQYPISLNAVQDNFGNSQVMASAIADLLRLWHQYFYRFGDFSQSHIKQCIDDKLKIIHMFKSLNIRDLSFKEIEIKNINELFSGFLNATAGTNSRFTRRSPTAVSKVLNLLAPKCFPLWDKAISLQYDCWWVYSDFGFTEYIKFMRISKQQCIGLVTRYSRSNNIQNLDMAEQKLIQDCQSVSNISYRPSLLKLIDEYNYAKFTKGWIT